MRSHATLRGAFVLPALVLAMSSTLAPTPSRAAAWDASAEGSLLRFEADGVSPRGDYVNRVTVGGQELAVLDQAVEGFTTVQLPIPGAMLNSGQVDVRIESQPLSSITIPAGVAEPGAAGPIDTFTVRDVRLVLPDGRELRDRDHEPGVDYTITGEAGDLGIVAPVTYNSMRRFVFTLPSPAGLLGGTITHAAAGVSGSGDAKPIRSPEDAVTQPLTADELEATSAADGVLATTQVDDAFPFQQFDVPVGELPEGATHVYVRWSGASPQGRGAALFGFDHHLERFVELATTEEDGTDGLALLAGADVDSFVRDGAIRLLVTEAPMDTAADSDFTIAWVTDSQFQTEVNLRPADLPGQVADWLVANAAERGIDYMAYTGDLVENGGADPSEFSYISEALQPLDDAGIPYGVVPGNHDYNGFGLGPSDQAADAMGTDPDLTVYAQFFGAARFEGRPWYAAQFRNNENHVDVLELGGQQLAFLYMGWDQQQEELDWAAEQLTGPLAGIPTVLALHEYLDLGEVLQDKGQTILEQLVMPHENLFAVISGHYHGIAYQVRRTDSGRVVLEMLHDYQDETEGGAAYFRLLHVDLDGQQLTNREYSPHHDDFLFDGFDIQRQEYTVPVQLLGADRVGIIQTDKLAVATDLQPTSQVLRLSGPDRVATAVAISEHVVLVDGTGALEGAPASLLGSLAPSMKTLLIAGGEAAIAPAVEAELRGLFA